MENEVRLSRDWSLGRTQCINSLSLLTNLWAGGRKQAQRSPERSCQEKRGQADSFSASTALPEVRVSGHSKLSASSGEEHTQKQREPTQHPGPNKKVTHSPTAWAFPKPPQRQV